MNRPAAILILCTGNSCRSHLAEAIRRERLGDGFRVESAGSRPAGFVHPLAIRALAEIGIDIGDHRSNHLEEFLGDQIENVITVCGRANQVCPTFPGQISRHHFPFDDPADAEGADEEQMETFRKVRDQIQAVFTAHAAGRLDQMTMSADLGNHAMARVMAP